MGTVAFTAQLVPTGPDNITPEYIDWALNKAMLRFANDLQNQGRLNATGKAEVGKSHPRKVSVRSGNLRDSISAFYQPAARELIFGAGLGPSRAYAAVHEWGRPWVLRPKRKKYLLVPLKPYLTAAGSSAQEKEGNRVWQNYDFNLVPLTGKGGKGSSKATAKTRHKAKKRDAPKKETGRSKRSIRGKGFLALEKSSGEPWYLLLKQVGPLRARPYLWPAIKKHQSKYIEGDLAKEMLRVALGFQKG